MEFLEDFEETKLKKHLVDRRMSIKDLERKIREAFPDEPMSYDNVYRIVSGERDNYHVRSLLRICKVLDLTPNDVIEY